MKFAIEMRAGRAPSVFSKELVLTTQDITECYNKSLKSTMENF